MLIKEGSDRKVVCISHTDGDGYASAAIVRHKYPNVEMYFTNYGLPLTVDVPDGSLVFVTDFMLPIDIMIGFDLKCEVIWIDHHRTQIDEAAQNNFNPKGLRDVSDAACALTWKYLFPDQKLPQAIRYLADYDMWRGVDGKSNTSAFSTGTYSINIKPNFRNVELWERLLTDDAGALSSIMDVGRRLLNFADIRNRIYGESLIFKTVFEGVPVLVANISNVNSLVFANWINDHPEESKDVKAVITFSYNAGMKKYRYSIYSNEPEFDVSPIAQKFGGGGHPGASGWQSEKILFDRTNAVPPVKLIEPEYDILVNAAKESKEVFESYYDVLKRRGSMTAEYGYIPGGSVVVRCNLNNYEVSVANTIAADLANQGRRYPKFAMFYWMDKNQMWRYVVFQVGDTEIPQDESLRYFDTIPELERVQFSTNTSGWVGSSYEFKTFVNNL